MAAKPKAKVNKKAQEKAKRKERQMVEQKRSDEFSAKQASLAIAREKAEEKARQKRAKELEKAIAKREKEKEALLKLREKENARLREERQRQELKEEERRFKEERERDKREAKREKERAKAEAAKLKAEKERQKYEEMKARNNQVAELKEAKRLEKEEAKKEKKIPTFIKRDKPKKNQSIAKRNTDKLNKLERIGAYIITIIDITIDIIEWFVTRTIVTFLRGFYALRMNIHRNAHVIIKDAALVIAAILILLVCFTSITDYQYEYNGRVLGIVHEQRDVLNILDLVSEELSKEYDSNIRINPERDISFSTVFSMNKDIDDQDTVLNKLSHMGQIQTQAFAISVNGEPITVLESERIAQQVLIAIQQLYLDPEEEYSEVGFAEDVTIDEVSVRLSDITNEQDAFQYIKSGAVQAKEYVVVPGDTLYGIAEKNGISYAELKEMNPNIKDTMVIHAGDKFKVQVEVPLVTVKTVGISTFAEAIPYDTEYKESSAYYVGETVTSRAGKNGRKSVTATLTKENGVIVGREDISSITIVEPTTRILVKGTKPTPPKQGTGTFKKPVNYRINSNYGMRNGRMHKGIDMACPTGTAVRAADGGTVIMSKWYGDYGYCVQIDHGGGYVTLYGHNSKLAVKVGEKVYQGQIIAYSGNTGRSTGPHCHFEIMYLGKNVNPAKYVK